MGSLLIFLLPLSVPLRPVATESASYNVGFNNNVAVGCAVLLSAAVFLLTWWRMRRAPPPPPQTTAEPLSPRFVAATLIVSAAVLGLSGWIVAASHLRYLGDAGYIIEQATVEHLTGRALYTQLEFAYGPLLLLPEIWLSELLRCSITTAYYITLVIESSLGLLMLAYVLNELPIRGDLRRWALALFAFGALTPHLGLNYTFFRFASPFAVLLFATRHRSLWRCVVLLAAGELLEVLISPELGLALGAGAVIFGLLRTWEAGWAWLLSALVPLAALAAVLGTEGRPYLRMAASFSRGALNLPVGPYPHLLVYLFALVWLVPVGLALRLRPGLPGSARLLAVYAVGLAFVPPALGRCDPLHILFNGVGVLALSLVWVSSASRRVRLAWVVALAVLMLWNLRVNDHLFAHRNAEVARETVLPHLPPLARRWLVRAIARRRPEVARTLAGSPEAARPIDLQALDRVTRGAPVVTPVDLTPVIEGQLIAAHQYAPGFYAFFSDMMNPVSERRSIDEVNGHRWMLLPAGWHPENFHTLSHIPVFQGMRMPYRERNRPPYDPGAAFVANLKKNWTFVGKFDDYTLLERREADAGSPGVSPVAIHGAGAAPGSRR